MKILIAAMIALGSAAGMQAQSATAAMDRAVKGYTAMQSMKADFRQTITNPLTGNDSDVTRSAAPERPESPVDYVQRSERRPDRQRRNFTLGLSPEQRAGPGHEASCQREWRDGNGRSGRTVSILARVALHHHRRRNGYDRRDRKHSS